MNRIIIFIAIFSSAIICDAGVRDFSLKRYGIDQDFGGIFIYDIVQDADGFLWIASDDGLYKFDGLTMTNLNDQDSTMGELITASVVSDDGHLYLGYYSGGISVVEHGRYRKLVTSEDLPGKIVKMNVDREGVIWALTQKGVLMTIDEGKTTAIKIDILSEMKSNDFIFHRDWMYVATSEGLLRFHNDSSQFTIDAFVLGNQSIEVNVLYEDPYKDDVLWVGTTDGLYEVQHVEGEHLEPVSGTEHFNITTIAKDHLETLWAGTSFHGLVELDLVDNRVHKITYFNKSNGFPSDQINRISVDRENEIWIGTFGNGLVQLNRAYFHHYELSRSIGIQGIHSVIEMNEDLFYFGTETGLVKAYNLPNRDSLNFSIIPNSRNLSVTQLFKTDDFIWIGTKEDGLFKYDPTTNSIMPVPFDYFVGATHVRCISDGGDGNYWISVAGQGVFLIDRDGVVLNKMNTTTGFHHNEIFSILRDDAGNVWFGSYGAGLVLLTEDGELKFLTRDKVFPGRDINTIKQDDKGEIWIATAGSGVYSFDGEEFSIFSEENGMLSDFCNTLEVDNSGQIWVGHRKGLSLIQPEIELVRRFNHPSELGETESVINSVFKDLSGNIWFGNPYGVTKVILPHIQHKIHERKAHIIDLRLQFKQVNLLLYSEQEKLDNILPNDLKFPHDQNHITFDYVSVNLKNPQAIYYKYKLKGLDKEWSPIGKWTEAKYANLDPGSYTFMVKESDHPDRWGESYEEISFKILLPYWETWWFYLAQIFVIFLMVFLTARLSQKLENLFWIRIMVYVSMFMVFEYVHTELEPFIERLSGDASIYKVALNLVLALLLLPLEIKLAQYLKKRREKKGLKTQNITAYS